MMESIIDESKVLRLEPMYSVFGVIVENEKHGKNLILSAKVAIICGIVGGIGIVSILSYFL